HGHSAVIVKGGCVVGVGDMLCSLSLPTLDLRWATKVDTATCFGVYYCPQHDCLLSHGESEIARVSISGQIVWSAGGKDIFSEGGNRHAFGPTLGIQNGTHLEATGGPGGACGRKSWGDGTAGLTPDPPGPPVALGYYRGGTGLDAEGGTVLDADYQE